MRVTWSVTLRVAVAATFLLFQLCMIGMARFDPARYFCWAPHDSQNEYRIHVLFAGRGQELTESEVSARYGIPARGIDPRAIEHIFRLVSQYERTHGVGDAASVRVVYRTNGGPEKQWQCPGR